MAKENGGVNRVPKDFESDFHSKKGYSMRFKISIIVFSFLISLCSANVRGGMFEEDEIQLRPAPIMRDTGVLKFLDKALVGFKASHLKKLRSGKVVKFRAARSFTTKNRGFGFKKGDMLNLKMTKGGKFIIDDNEKSTKGMILMPGSSKMGIVIIERSSGMKQAGKAIMGENDRIVISPFLKSGALKLNKGVQGKKLQNR